MLSFFGLRKDSKKSTPEKEVDGGFVIVGETSSEEQRRRTPSTNVAQPSTNVIVQPAKPSYPVSPLPAEAKLPTPMRPTGPAEGPPAADAASTLPDLLGDIPFTLAPHVLAVQAGFSMVPDVLLSRDINYNLASFQYDFTLENSVLHSN
ncbi:UBAP1-MVB12-associated (UMA)-domain containing protein 1 [Kryptolebias marmoratus]|uniref:UBAP1-MVB12-associated (UMA)-domain containing protein 1 n=1 Tax=Kryptolebias marmoratus TaxID=37003 RepID=UPI0018ACC403|nr:UBAP1-MVB12-associated (UMA)-domain containing protein 1 [Kryptolebias marmoratus]XP_037831675.1 UBAP1-MVB12-associated (UMA)-domain containing protein 1 [Kryptolebias marmoratus]